jgi:hypothetical protein
MFISIIRKFRRNSASNKNSRKAGTGQQRVNDLLAGRLFTALQLGTQLPCGDWRRRPLKPSKSARRRWQDYCKG